MSAETGSRHSDQEVKNLSPLHAQPEDATADGQEERRSPPPSLLAPDIPVADLSVDFSAIMGTAESKDSAENVRIEKRKSNLLELGKENEKLRQELKALNDRIEAAERKRVQLQARDTKSVNL